MQSDRVDTIIILAILQLLCSISLCSMFLHQLMMDLVQLQVVELLYTLIRFSCPPVLEVLGRVCLFCLSSCRCKLTVYHFAPQKGTTVRVGWHPTGLLIQLQQRVATL